jgi:signal transduction histidine kinase
VLNILLIFLALTDRLRSGELRILENSRMTEQRAIAIAGEMTHELKENKERLEISLLAELQSTERLQRFLVMLSHEYRTPLAIIQGNIDLLERQIMQQCSGCQPEFMKMRRAVQRLVEVMDVSLEQSRLAEPRATEDYQCVPVGRFVAKQINTVRLMWPEKTFRLDSLPDAGLLYGELPLRNTALFNLLYTARKYSPSSTQVAVSCRNGGRVAVIRITNEIEGFLPDNTERLFEKYHRGTNVAAIGGAGVGLWLVRQIVTRHGGRVHLRCRKEGFVTVTLKIGRASCRERVSSSV